MCNRGEDGSLVNMNCRILFFPQDTLFFQLYIYMYPFLFKFFSH